MCRAQNGNAILVYLWPENIVNIWNVLWLSRRLIICTEQESTYISTFPNALTSKKVINNEISIYFSIEAIVTLLRTAIILKFKMRWFPNEAH